MKKNLTVFLLLLITTSVAAKCLWSVNTLPVQTEPVYLEDICNLDFDTISNPNYSMHLSILKRIESGNKTSSTYTNDGKEIRTFLYDQDVAAFSLGLNPNEKGIYRILTNKVVFLILENEGVRLNYGLTAWTKNPKQLNYFLKNISHPICNNLSISRIIEKIKTEMDATLHATIHIKRLIIKNLEKASLNQ